jgi:hypothetical protein
VSRTPRIELLWWSGCPSWSRTLADLREAVLGAGLDPEAIEVREVVTEEDAERVQFAGSPTIRLDGVDVLPPGKDEPRGFTCRIYRLRDGRISPTPDPADLREAIEAAADVAAPETR